MSNNQNSQTTNKKKIPQWLNIIGQLLIFALIIGGISWWQERHLLSKNDQAQAPSMSLISIDGKNYPLPVKGNKQLVYFFAPWCTICDISIGNIESQKDSLQQKGYQVRYVALSWQSQQEIVDFAEEHKLTFPVLLGTEQTATNYQVKGFPTYYLIDETGQVTGGSQGYSTSLGVWLRSL